MAAADVVTVPDAPPIAVYVAFFEHGTYHAGGGGAKSVWDTLAAAWDALTAVHLRRISPAFEHCNLVFEWRGHPNNLWLSFSTTIKNPSCFILTEYKDVNWRGVHLDRLSEDDRQRLFLWAMQNVGTPFDFCGYYWNFLLGPTYCDCCAVDADGNAFYCAEQVATALWFVNAHPVFGRVRPYKCTPDVVYKLLVETAQFPPVAITTGLRSGSEKNKCAGKDCCCFGCLTCMVGCCCCFYCRSPEAETEFDRADREFRDNAVKNV